MEIDNVSKLILGGHWIFRVYKLLSTRLQTCQQNRNLDDESGSCASVRFPTGCRLACKTGRPVSLTPRGEREPSVPSLNSASPEPDPADLRETATCLREPLSCLREALASRTGAAPRGAFGLDPRSAAPVRDAKASLRHVAVSLRHVWVWLRRGFVSLRHCGLALSPLRELHGATGFAVRL